MCILVLNLLGHLTNNPEQEINNYNPEMVPIVTFFRQSLGIWHLVFASILWRFYRSNDKSLIRFLLFVCIAFSLAKITLILYYDHCTLIRLKTWLTTLICSKCSNDSSTTDYGSCTRFGSNSIQYLPPSEIATYLSIESIELLINVLYHHKMSISNVNNASNSILTSGTISSGRITTKRTCSFEYVSFLFNSYLINPFVRLFHCSATTNESETTNSSIPNAKTEETEKMSVPHRNKSNE
ncbi:hypothetical protein BLOT_014243 [Blomia tropicalis]|nr:hypothetical protein BLOT_014243 [Blomia tropicalis]